MGFPHYLLRWYVAAFLTVAVSVCGSEYDRLQTALEFSGAASFQATGKSRIFGKRYTPLVLDQFRDSEDGFVFRRMEVDGFDRNSPRVISIRNRDGYFRGYILREKDFSWLPQLPLDPAWDLRAEEAGHKDVSCRRYTLTLPPGASKEVARVVFLVGNENALVYSWAFLDAGGNVLEELTLDEVIFTEAIPADRFTVTKPAGTDGAAILQAALDVTGQASFKAVVRQPLWGEDMVCVYYQSVDPKTEFVFKRFDIHRYDPRSPDGVGELQQSEFQNRDGRYHYNGLMAVKLNYGRFYWPPRDTVDPLVPVEVKEISFRGRECWQLTVRYPRDYPPAGERNAQWPYTRVFIIGKSDHFIYDWKYYNASAKELVHYDFSKVEFNPPLSADWFEVPAGVELGESSSPAETREVYIGNLPPSERASARGGGTGGFGRFWRDIGNWENYKFDSIVTWVSRFLLLLGVICLIAVVRAKVKNRLSAGKKVARRK